MEFQRFSIGARFVISGSVQDTAARAWSLLFDFLSPKEVAGLQLYGVYQEPNEIEREPAYICVCRGLHCADASRSMHGWRQIR